MDAEEQPRQPSPMPFDPTPVSPSLLLEAPSPQHCSEVSGGGARAWRLAVLGRGRGGRICRRRAAGRPDPLWGQGRRRCRGQGRCRWSYSSSRGDEGAVGEEEREDAVVRA
uniref:Uncharacterized protein n=1 Tax=Oryza sativa subsp. japonica TaxID=39947 RepID=Q8H429_ORYSJ|nr:hypothetical protein [Oryza sativa Japonica Group]